jgi:predicted component of type VI protein secretion system
MKKNDLLTIMSTITILLLVNVNVLFAQTNKAPMKTTIEKIVDNPGAFIDETVIVQGLVVKYFREPSHTNSFYSLKGKYDGKILVKVEAQKEPLLEHFYEVKGTVFKENGNVFIHQTETAEIPDLKNYTWGNSNEVLDNDDVSNLEKSDKIEKDDSGEEIGVLPDKGMSFYIIVAAIVIVIIVLVVLLIKMTSKKNEVEVNVNQPTSTPPPVPQPAPQPVQSTSVSDDDYKTIKLVRDSAKTLKFIPGKLEIVSGPDAGKSFRLSGYPTSQGSVVTIGTLEEKGDRQYAHIQIDKSFRTVSRRQAEIIFNEKEKKLYIKNLSNTNYTKVDDVELNPNEAIELKDGSVISMGELSFRYTK